MVKSMSEVIKASITSPEQGAQQECSSNFFPSFGKLSFSRLDSLLSMIAVHLKYDAILRQTARLYRSSLRVVASLPIYTFIFYFCNVCLNNCMAKCSPIYYVFAMLALILRFYA